MRIRTQKTIVVITVAVTAFILLVHIMIVRSPLQESPVFSIEGHKLILSVEESICETRFEPKTHWVSPCQKSGIITVVQGGRLGNQIWEYAAVWAISKKTGLIPYVPRCTKEQLDTVFESLAVPTLEEISHCPINSTTFAMSLQAWEGLHQNLLLPKWSTEERMVSSYTQEIKAHFVYRRSLVEKAQNILHSLIKGPNTTFVGVHVRRTDYMEFIKKNYNVTPATAEFYLAAVKYFEGKYPNVQFVVASDDVAWCNRYLKLQSNIYITEKGNTMEEDLALLSSCNHSIFDYGTYGAWGALYAGGETVYADVTNSKYNFLEHFRSVLPYWHPL